MDVKNAFQKYKSLGAEPRKNSAQDGLRSDVWIAIGVDEIFRLVPFDLRIEDAQHEWNISAGERLIDRPDSLGILRHAHPRATIMPQARTDR